MSYPSKDDFQQTLEIAEFAVQRLENRRQYEFKIFISYVTLLVLAIYKHELLKSSTGDFVPLVCVLLFLMHCFYISWTIRLSVANRNDSKRRNFYLQKSEYISHYLLKKFGDPLCGKMDNEHCSLNQEENKIKRVPGPISAFKHIDHLCINYAATFFSVLSTILLFLLICICCIECCEVLYAVCCAVVGFIVILTFLAVSITMLSKNEKGNQTE